MLWFVGGFILLGVILFFAVRTASFQTWLAQRATAYLSNELNAKVYVDKVEIRFIKSVVLKGLYVEDLHHDTLLYADELTVNISQFNNSKRLLDISKLKLANASFFLTRYNGEDYDNLKFISDYFSSNDTTPSDSAKWKVTFEKLQLDNVRFCHVVEKDSIKPRGVDFSHLDLRNINGEFDNVHFINDSIFTVIKGLRFKDRSGFELTDFSGDTKFTTEGLRIKDLVIKSPFTDIHTNLAFQYDSLSDFDDFEKKVHWQSDFRSSTISFHDIAYFASDLWGINKSLILTGECSGTVDKFKCKNVLLNFGAQSYFKGNIAMTGLPNIEETYFDVRGDDIVVFKKDLETIPVAPFDSGGHLKIPDNLTALGRVNFKGKFTGFYNDFVAYGNISTALGYLSSDLNLKYDRDKKKEFYSGHLATNSFDIGKITESNDLGIVSLNVDLKGSGLRLDNAEATLKGIVSLLKFRGYSYRNINIDGKLSKKLFEGAFDIAEPNVDLAFKGHINFQHDLPEFNFAADINHLHLDTLKLYHLPGDAEISSHVLINLTGNKLDNIEGTIQINDFNYKVEKSLYHINNISLSSEIDKSKQHLLHLSSDFLNADFKGQFEFATLGRAFSQILPEYFPKKMGECKRVNSAQDFTFNINIKNISLITERFLPSWWIEPNTSINGRFNAIHNSFNISLNSPRIRYKNLQLINERLEVSAGNDSIKLSSSADSLFYSTNSFLQNPKLIAYGLNDKVHFKLHLADSVIYQNRGFFGGSLTFEDTTRMFLNFADATLYLENEQWSIEKGNHIVFDTSAIVFSHFNVSSKSGAVGLDGTISKNPDDKLILKFSDFSLIHLNPVISPGESLLGGIMNGQADLKELYAQPNIVSELTIKDFALNGDTLGNASINSAYDDEKKVVQLSIDVMKNDVKTMSIKGDYNTALSDNNIDFKIQLQNVYISPYERYINDVFSNLRGKISADLNMTGTFSKPVLKGYLDFSKSGFKVIYLNTYYTMNDRVWVGENYFEFKNFVLKDFKGNTAKLNGKIEHDVFKNLRFNARITTDNFQGLNTSLADNDLFYGTGYFSGYASFSGPLENLNLDMRIKSTKGSEINIPLGTSSEISRGDYITFINKTDTSIKKAQAPRVNTSGINLNLQLEVTQDAWIELIFDEKIGDKIKGNGNGNLNFTLTPSGEFNIYGQYIIEKGDYLFTLRNIINKHFNISRGGVLSWQGNPYDADVNLNATYTGSTSTLYKLIQDSTYRRRLTYDVVLDLTNKLMNPTIRYSINVRGLDAASESQVKSRLNSEAAVSNQVFGLLVLGQFIPDKVSSQNVGSVDARSGAGASASELLSNQVSNWLSQVSKNVSLGFNYKAKDTYSKEEIDLLFSKTLFDERLTIEGNVGVANDQNASNVIGDFNLEYNLSPVDNRFKLKAFNRSNINNVTYYNSPYTQGVGIVYRGVIAPKKEEVKTDSTITPPNK